jgi:cytochrome c biogenesis protein CcmG/thiol:disulfide interchange protein DsbE
MARWMKLGLLFVFALVAMQLLLRPPASPKLGGGQAPRLSTWCPPCRAEIPELAELWREQKEGCFELLGVAEESPRADLLAIARTMPYPVLTDPRGDAAAAWSVYGFPSSYLVDPQGKVVRVFEGAVRKRQVLEAMRPHLPASCTGS